MRPMKLARAVVLALCAIAWNAHAGKVVDDRGVALELPRPPQRIVVMLPSLTEMVCELGACDRLVGLDDYSNWPAQVRGLPRLGGLEDTNVERATFKPCLAYQRHSAVASQLLPAPLVVPSTMTQRATTLLGSDSN